MTRRRSFLLCAVALCIAVPSTPFARAAEVIQ